MRLFCPVAIEAFGVEFTEAVLGTWHGMSGDVLLTGSMSKFEDRAHEDDTEPGEKMSESECLEMGTKLVVWL